ncbi:MAG TPA: hypothetical protein PL155_01075 [Candidatus Omnitrophota bacterium]|nr:hypothetical protein [Candidatus Omnitrophota bacterium]HPD84922.1 hypothetical protein [Candidatus Omnitrophota bacterium]HRZ03780.1 hypothetical protein [Candidatus Omnitrophota bacterium]
MRKALFWMFKRENARDQVLFWVGVVVTIIALAFIVFTYKLLAEVVFKHMLSRY